MKFCGQKWVQGVRDRVRGRYKRGEILKGEPTKGRNFFKKCHKTNLVTVEWGFMQNRKKKQKKSETTMGIKNLRKCPEKKMVTVE